MIKNFLFVLMIVCSLAACKKEKPKEVVLNAKPTATQTVANAMPSLTLTQVDGKTINMRELTGKVLLVCYNPGCDHCQREARQLADNKDILAGYEVFFLTPETLEESDKFQKEYKLTDPNIHFGRSDVPQIISAIGAINTVPTFFVYKDQALVKRLEGEITIADLRNVMQ